MSLDPARSERESEVDCVPLPHYIPIRSECHLNQQHTVTPSIHMQVIQKVLWRWASGKAAGEETLETVVEDLHTGGLILYDRFP